MILVVNKVDRPDARIAEVVDEVYELFIDLGATEKQIEFPIVYTNARAGFASLTTTDPGTSLKPLMDTLLDTIPAPEYEEGEPLQAHVTNLDASAYVGRLAICRVRNGTIKKGSQVAWCRADGTITPVAHRRALHHRGAGPRRRRRGRPGRDHRRRRHARRHDRRDAGRPRGPAAAAGDHRRRAVDQRHDRHQPLAAGRPGRQQAHRPPDPGPADRRDDRQRVDPRAADRAPGHLGGPGPRRAAARRSSSRSCAARASSSPSASRRSSSARSTASATSRSSA